MKYSKWISKIIPTFWCIIKENEDGSFHITDSSNDRVKGIRYNDLNNFLRVEAPLQLYQDITFKDQLLDKYTNINKLQSCTHEYKHYTGIVEHFKYCVHCDEKIRDYV